MRVSVLVPAYEMGGLGKNYLNRNLDSICSQELETEIIDLQVEIVVSDHSSTGELRSVAESYPIPPGFQLRYVLNELGRGSASSNLNFAFSRSSGEIVKILFQDDFFIDSHALITIVTRFAENPGEKWLVSGCSHSRDGTNLFSTMVPRYHDEIHLGGNTISSPSVLALRREGWLGIDTRLRWLLDVDYYKAMHEAFGPPIIEPKPLVANGIGPHQVTALGISRVALLAEKIVVSKKHGSVLFSVVFPGVRTIIRKVLRSLRKRVNFFWEHHLSGRTTPECAGALTRVDAINRVIASVGGTRYLEIGVNTTDQPGYSRDSIVVSTKHGIDPNPETAADFVMTSDQFFATQKTDAYDVIFVDGLHLFEQAYRDVVNSLERLSDKGVVIVHDTRPTNRLSASRQQGKSLKWLGDVWRAAYLLRLTHDDVEMATLDADEGITLIWKKYKPSDRLFLSGDDVFSWNHYTKTYREALRLVSDQEFFQLFPLPSDSDVTPPTDGENHAS